MNLRLVLFTSIAAVAATCGIASADVTASTATDPNARIAPRVSSLLGAERKFVGSVGDDRLKKVTEPFLDKTGAIDRSGENSRVAAVAPSAAIRPEPRPVTYSRKFLSKLPKATGGADQRCLAEALYFEARGESVKGQFAVAEVILNRVDHPLYPETVCGVVNQGTGRKWQCQFTYTCDGLAEVIRERRAYDRVSKIAKLMIDGSERRLTAGATHYHTTAVNPKWNKAFPKTAKIGSHLFYRQAVPKRYAKR